MDSFRTYFLFEAPTPPPPPGGDPMGGGLPPAGGDAPPPGMGDFGQSGGPPGGDPMGGGMGGMGGGMGGPPMGGDPMGGGMGGPQMPPVKPKVIQATDVWQILKHLLQQGGQPAPAPAQPKAPVKPGALQS